MLIHSWDAPGDDTEWQRWLAAHDFGQLAVNGLPGEPPHIQPLHFAYDAERGEVVTHLARPHPLWPALEANPQVVLSVVDDYVYIPGPWQAAPHVPSEHGVPTSFYTAVQLRCTAQLVDDPAQKAELLNRRLGHFQPEGGSARAAVGEAPYGRMLSGIRGVRLVVTDLRAKFKYAGHKPDEVRERIAAGLAGRCARRGGARASAAQAHRVTAPLAQRQPRAQRDEARASLSGTYAVVPRAGHRVPVLPPATGSAETFAGADGWGST